VKEYHARIIAHFVVNGWDDPIRFEYSFSDRMCCSIRARLTQKAAAILLTSITWSDSER